VTRCKFTTIRLVTTWLRKKEETMNIFHGPGGTTYRQVAQTAHGRVGVTDLGGAKWRVRVEPSSSANAEWMEKFFDGWNQPSNGNLRFSLIVGNDDLANAEALALSAIGFNADDEKCETMASLAAQARKLADAIEVLRG
jgi:hypothetical protein